MLNTLFHHFMTTISLLTAFGVFMHDGRVDKATLTATGVSGLRVYANNTSLGAKFADFVATDAHTHPDHNTGRGLMSGFAYQSPTIGPRRDTHHKQILRILEAGGRHAFDNTNLPIIT